jgi:hypothetical protein
MTLEERQKLSVQTYFQRICAEAEARANPNWNSMSFVTYLCAYMSQYNTVNKPPELYNFAVSVDPEDFTLDYISMFSKTKWSFSVSRTNKSLISITHQSKVAHDT